MNKPKYYLRKFFKRVSQISILFLVLLNTSTIAQADTPFSLGIGFLSTGILNIGLHLNGDYHYNENCTISLSAYYKKQKLELDEVDFKSKFGDDLIFDGFVDTIVSAVSQIFNTGSNSKDKQKSDFIPKLSIQVYPFIRYSIYFAGFAQYHNIDIDRKFNTENSSCVKVSDKGFRSGLAIGYNSAKHKRNGFGLSFEVGSILSSYELDVKVKHSSRPEITKKVKSKFSPYVSLQAQYKL